MATDPTKAMISAKMKILLQLVVWIFLANNVHCHGIGFGIKSEIFFLNLEDGYFGCQVNESTDFLQLYELSRLCDGHSDCYRGSDELRRELKCTTDCAKESGTTCQNGACLDSQCHCNDGFGGCSCEVPDENECKYRPCDVFAHCTNTLGSFHCSCFPGYAGDGFHCQDINECEDPRISARCVVNAECCNLPAHFLCKCLPGFEGDGEVQCDDINECLNPEACGVNAVCINTPGNYTCDCIQGFGGNPYDGCGDINECGYQGACGPGAQCSNTVGGHVCTCPPGTTGDPVHEGCVDTDECLDHPCGLGAICTNTLGSFTCDCPTGHAGDPFHECTVIGCIDDEECPSQNSCLDHRCQDPCIVNNPCAPNEECQVHHHQPACVKVCHCQKNSDCRSNLMCDGCNCVPPSAGDERVVPGCEHCPPGVPCDHLTGACIKAPPGTPKRQQPCQHDGDCLETEACYDGMCEDLCGLANVCAPSAKCHVVKHRPVCTCPHGHQGNPAVKCFLPQPLTCLSNEDCGITEACIGHRCQHPCDVYNPCAQNAVCVNTNHGCDCSCAEGFHGNGFVGCVPVMSHKSVCQYNEDCPPDKLCDRLNRVCINPCAEDSCGDHAQCFPNNHGIDCRCPEGYSGNPYIECSTVSGCRRNSDCHSNEACIKGTCGNPCNCGPNAVCDVVNHKPICKCLPGYGGNANLGCTGPLNPCDPNPCGINALCEVDAGGPICYCPKGMTGNPFKNCIPEGDECLPNPCGPHSGCRIVGGSPVCFCLPEYEGSPPERPCSLPRHPCAPSPCGPNTQCAVLPSGLAKCTCLPGHIESPNTIRGCVARRDPCRPSPCGPSAHCDANRNPPCYCPDPLIGNPYKSCGEPVKSLCHPGPCGANSDCYVTGSTEQCYCRPGYSGDPYSGCITTPCVPNPCGPGALCTVTPDAHPMCSCPEGMAGDPTGLGCTGPQCTTDDQCPWDTACMAYRCRDPCPGACGVGASCRVEKHHPVCTCNHGLTGNPLVRCYPIQSVQIPSGQHPCLPSPCGLNTLCKVSKGRPVCSCLAGYQGNPKQGCRAECTLNTDCPAHMACHGLHCVDPCTVSNVCGIGAVCTCRDHTALCSCPSGTMGDPLIQCITRPPLANNSTLACSPSPCGPGSICSVYDGHVAVCSPTCGGQGWCRPECLTDSDCPFDLTCLSHACRNPCPGSCGLNAGCQVVKHQPICYCPQGLIGNPFEHCVPPPPSTPVKPDSCERIRCGANARCREYYGQVTCVCPPGLFGDPYLACRPECVTNSDCHSGAACINAQCQDPCPGACGVNSQCTCINHVPVCHCPEQHTGDPFVSCYPFNPALPPALGQPGNPCDPSPCGPNSRCLVSAHGFAACSCLPGYRGSPPVCQPECLVSAECPPSSACLNQKCQDPCPGTCGLNARCQVINHNPICSCPPGHVGDPFVRCNVPPAAEEPKIPGDPCNPSPCGPHSLCVVRQRRPVCSCEAEHVGSPPFCRPECTLSQECPHHLACQGQKCRDPCPGSCGPHATCSVVNHTPFCVCHPGYQGDAFVGCSKIPTTVLPEVPKDPCELSPCGGNAQCSSQGGAARCSCIPPYVGDPYGSGCRPECLMNADCPPHLACLAAHCRDPCPGVCGTNAQCSVVNHVPVCSCLPSYIGDPFQSCRQPPPPVAPVNPCEPSPCGPNSMCRVRGGAAVCSCTTGYVGVPPACRPECVASAECPASRACINQKCQDPCPGTCGLHARCHVVNHNPICSCPPKMVGDPFVRCVQEAPRVPTVPVNPCMPSPCGGNSECRVVDHRPVCSCLPGMLGAPPNCRPECLIHADCPTRLACIQSKCKDPCTGSCGFNAACSAVNHQPVCTCLPGFKGDPFSGCNPIPATERTPVRIDPCFPSPCGANAECHDRNGVGGCSCLPGFQGDPYSGCRRECETNTDCAANRACIGFKCVDPCPGTCGNGAECTITNHIPVCSCPAGYTGDPFFACRPTPPTPPPRPEDPCIPSPCGPNSQCRPVNQQAVCSCLPQYVGSPPSCRPECLVSAECPLDRACVNQRCQDPCPNTCGLRAQCTVKNHNPICACPQGYTGDPFSRCTLIPAAPITPPTPEPPSCTPSPCGPHAECRMTPGGPSCSCLPDRVGTPPNCRPECLLSAECPPQQACIGLKCRDPCPGSCGANAQCQVINHVPVCTCSQGYTGDPFTLCSPAPITTPAPPTPSDPCNPSPCGPNAVCRTGGTCECQPEYQGNPYEGCRPECVLSAECPRDRACIRNKCRDPCPGTCGQGAQCDIINHIPTCSCPQGYTGDPFTLCRLLPAAPVTPVDPCNPSPCGSNSQCRAPSGVAVCSCLPGYMGAPPSCRPECLVSAECPSQQACVNQKCVDPCKGTCGLNARCQVINHSPICSCPQGQTGDPFRSCYPIPPPPAIPITPRDPCSPSPCGPNSQCQSTADKPACSCLPGYVGLPPGCRPECTINPDCPPTLACVNNKCSDPCPGSCGNNAQCSVISHAVTCTCSPGFTGNPFVECTIQKQEIIRPCEPSPCGSNAVCRERNGAGSCACIEDYTGNPYEGCRPECVLSADCPSDRACVRSKCQDPCPGVCGPNAQCQVVNHVPTCTCIQGYVGDPFQTCSLPPPPVVTEATVADPCAPSPCGPNSQCRNVQDQAVCSCLPQYVGAPPNCRPECVVNSECPSNRACYKNKCQDPCPGTCGLNARCQVINHNPICSCPPSYTGDPFSRCYPTPPPPPEKPATPTDPCSPSPCGPHSQCQPTGGGQASCSCRPGYVGSPPSCRPECLVNTDCAPTQACISEKCRDPCPGSCGLNARCTVHNHVTTCSCEQAFTGDPFTQCTPIPIESRPAVISDPCTPSPCGANTRCDAGACSCLPEYSGDPYTGCRPECTMNSDCPRNRACLNQKCVDPCPGICGQAAQCDVINHIPTCTCPPPTTGDPFVACHPPRLEAPRDPCSPSPCGPHSQCRVSDGHAVCSCRVGMVGAPPQCRPECLVSAECPLTQACLNQKCVDPCPGTCGLNARCQVVNHNPICSCPSGQTGDPFRQCYPIPVTPKPPPGPVDPCRPSPCGPNSQCSHRSGNPACSCLPNYVGSPPACRPECTINPECPPTQACLNQKCRDPCSGSCGASAVCSVVNHTPVCSCSPGTTGDPFSGCVPVQALPPPGPSIPRDPCSPSPCGSNARCQATGDHAYCECDTEYQGDPYTGCRPECVVGSDCPMDRACIRNKCQDPCPGTCGLSALCTVSNHVPICTCPPEFTGDAFTACRPIPPTIPSDPCFPSPCGPNTQCRSSPQGAALCECLPGTTGDPSGSGCRPECVLSADCPPHLGCLNQKCRDPCPGVCGYAALCHVVNHSPVCACPPDHQGDPFVECKPAPAPPSDPCNPSPCNRNGQCRVVNGVATCVYPECVINEDCPRDRACFSYRCRDPCASSCGLNALCRPVNHQPVCSCPPGYAGQPKLQCFIRQEEPKPKPECTSDDECGNDKACINEMCTDPCNAETTSVCAYNAMCTVLMHRPICACRDGMTGNAQAQCFDIGCRSDSQCPPAEACVNRQCVDACRVAACGTGAVCQTVGGRARCHCPPGFRGDPLVTCHRPQCTSDPDCPTHLACRNENCADPCECAPTAICSVSGHVPTCRCPPGYIGNPRVACTPAPVETPPKCKMDSDCASKLACFSGECRNPCVETKPCGKNAECIVVDTLPLRTMSCQCLMGFVGDADVQCIPAPEEEAGCSSDFDCSNSETCVNRKCVDPCALSNPCARNALCHPANHKAQCTCPETLTGDPFVNCYRLPISSPECSADSDCPSLRACLNGRCQDPCLFSNPCGIAAQCTAVSHRATCSCPAGWAGDPQLHCYKPECKVDTDCLYDKACHGGSCVSPCVSAQCGRGAECKAADHRAVCQCPPGSQGDARVACVSVICHYNEDCGDTEACDRLNRVCRSACEGDTCGDNAKCTASRHQPTCNCLPGFQGDPYIQCIGARIPTGECTHDSDCGSKLACIDRKCQSPCSLPAVCSPGQECRVQDTMPLRTVMCVCPSDTITSPDGHCIPIVTTECRIDTDCRDTDRCVRGSCKEACRTDPCGLNALCTSRSHQALCSCPEGYTGNPHIECSVVTIYPPMVLPVPECSSDSECASDRRCRNQICVHPCAADSPCAPAAFCHADNHKAVCRCPPGFQGDPYTQCTPPSDVLTVGCASNSECSPQESCINRMCISPCACGPNAECRVENHIPICHCKPGFSGNPQIGCDKIGCESDEECSGDNTCYNGECINPCIMGDPCGVSSECFGASHRAQCRCYPGFTGNPSVGCTRIECSIDADCASDRACVDHHCVSPCGPNAPCAPEAICYSRNHVAACRCPDHAPMGDPASHCLRPPVPSEVYPSPECTKDPDCPSKQACINERCQNPCNELKPCQSSARCSVFDTMPVRTMICTCPEGWVPNDNGECKPVLLPSPPGCTKDDDCSTNETCINRMCRNPCDCGANAQCFVQNHRPVCSCIPGFNGNPNIACRAVGCRSNSECESGKACINGNCLNPCIVADPCGVNAECFPAGSKAECRCMSGYRGNPYDRCLVVGCRSNADCPNDRSCVNAQCINSCSYDKPCAPNAECRVRNHLAVCRCPPDTEGNPYTVCRVRQEPECRRDADCPTILACFDNICKNPCTEVEPCNRPADCEVTPSLPVRTMTCVCPPGYVSSGSGTCKATPPVVAIGECSSDSDCPVEKACINGICRDPCRCGPNAQCRVRDHKPVCSCLPGFDGNPELDCVKAGCTGDWDCLGSEACLDRRCVPACSPDGSSCGTGALCHGVGHQAVCVCPPGWTGDPRVGCLLPQCESNTDCPLDRACVNTKCVSPCAESDPCELPAQCIVHRHSPECVCPPGYIGTTITGCKKVEKKCEGDFDCPTQTACINDECVNPCNVTAPCGVNTRCQVFDTYPVRTMICECLPGFHGNAAVQCDKLSECPIDKGLVLDEAGRCVCPPGTGLNPRDECVRCQPERGLKIDSTGRCICDLERGLVINERGDCICPEEHGYRLDLYGNCVLRGGPPECESDDDCPDHRYCNVDSRSCEDPCVDKKCGINALCNATKHQAFCQCISGYVGDPYLMCNTTSKMRTDFPRPDMVVSCLSDGVQVEIHIEEKGFNGVLYVKGHSKDEKCRRVVSLPNDSQPKTEIFKVNFGSCGLIHVNGQASFILVIQKHPMLVTFKTQAYHIKCVYTTGEQNVTLGFNVSMLTTAGTIANTGPPPTCLMRIVTRTGQEISSAEIGDNLMLQVTVQPANIYGGFARSCVAKTMEDSVENEYIVTDENGCATDPAIFGEWDYSPETQSLLASFNAFKFPSSDNIRFQCNIRVCFGKCQPVNCRGYNAYGRRKREAIEGVNNTGVEIAESVSEGQLREEITIQSNAILTFERREERFVDPTEAPDVQQIEDICVSMIGFIIALVVTALLALVAVAVAVSCWLVAYRRRPQPAGPLPHPPEFPNPLFTTPEPVAEPSPDYLS